MAHDLLFDIKRMIKVCLVPCFFYQMGRAGLWLF
ncbi:unnamed protein product [Rhodiola kirilowii]